MATNVKTKESLLMIALGKLHPDYTIEIQTELVNRVYPVMFVFNKDYTVRTEIRLPTQHWDVRTLDRLVKKSISKIEDSSRPAIFKRG